MNGTVLMVEIAGAGGICHYTYNLCRSLARFRRVRLMTAKTYELADRPREFELEGVFNGRKTTPLALVRLMRRIRSTETRTVHFQLSQFPALVLLMLILSKIAGKPAVVTSHNVVSHEEKKWEKAVYRWIYRLADRVIVHAEDSRRELKRIFRVNDSRIGVIDHGNYMFFESSGSRVNEDVPDSKKVLFFGYIRPYKGLEYLIKAVAIAREHVPDIVLHIAGKVVGDFAPYERLIRSLGLERNLELTLGYVPFSAVRKIFSSCNLVVLPYLKIYQSGILHLAYSLSRPVIVTDVGGLPEAVEQGKSGIIVPAGDERSLAGAMVEILSDRGLQRTMGAFGRKLAESRFSWSTIGEKTSGVYRALLQERTYVPGTFIPSNN